MMPADQPGTLLGVDWVVPAADSPPRQGWALRVVGESVDAVGPFQELAARFPHDRTEHFEGCVLAPGFVNAHTHLYGVLAHGIPTEKAPSDFWSFLADFWWPLVEDGLDHAMIAAATDWACLELLRSGVTTVYDCLEAPYAIPGALMVQKEVVARRGIRAILSFEATERVSRENGQLGLEENAAFIRRCREEGGPIQGLMCFHTTFTCSAEFIRQAFALGEALDVPVHMHCNEGIHEPEYALRHFGKRTLEYYDELGVAGPRMLASQCVQLSAREQQILAERGVRVTHMPLSNCEVGGGIAPMPRLLDAGVIVGLGSDGYINDFFEVMRGAFLIHKAAHQDPRVMPAALVWRMATEMGAQALGLERVGRLEPGWAADLQVIQADLPTPLSAHNLLEQLLLWRNHTQVRHVMVAGRWRVRDGEVLDADLPAIRARLHEQARRLWERVR